MIRVKKKRKQSSTVADWQKKKIVEANRLCVAVAVWNAWCYYGYREQRMDKLIRLYWDTMEVKRKEFDCDKERYSNRLARLAESQLDNDAIRNVHGLGYYEWMCSLELFRAECYLLCCSVMILTLKELGFSRELRTNYVFGLIEEIRANSSYRYFDELLEDTGYDVREHIRWD